MKKIIFLIISFYSCTVYSQYAKNFNCNDCNGNKHDLFNELDSGYIIVLDWVMPCISCIAPSKTAYNIVQSYSDSFPGKIRMYICDDLADTYCFSLTSWANNNSMPNTIKFSDTSIKMEDYGFPGMPKIVILGNKSHYVYFNEVDFEAGNITKIQNALNDALAGKAAINKIKNIESSIVLKYDFIGNKYYLKFNLANPSVYNCEIIDLAGKKLSESIVYAQTNNSQTELDFDKIKNGIYLVKVYNSKIEKTFKILINNY